MGDRERTRAQTRARTVINDGDNVEEPAEALASDLVDPTLPFEEGGEETVEPNPHETDASGGESIGMPKRLCFTRIEDRVVLLSEVEASGFYAPLEYGMKGKLIAQMQQNLKQHRSDTFPHGATTSSKTFESQVDKELMSYQERLQGKGKESGDHINGGDPEIDRLCESIEKQKSDRDMHEALSANEKQKALALKENLKQRADEARTAAMENMDTDNRSATPRRSPTPRPEEQPVPFTPSEKFLAMSSTSSASGATQDSIAILASAIEKEAKSSADIATRREDRADRDFLLRHKRACENHELRIAEQESNAQVKKMRLEVEGAKAAAAASASAAEAARLAAASEAEAARLHIGATAEADAMAKKAEGELAIAKATASAKHLEAEAMKMQAEAAKAQAETQAAQTKMMMEMMAMFQQQQRQQGP